MSRSMIRTGESIIGATNKTLNKASSIKSHKQSDEFNRILTESNLSRDTFKEKFRGRDQKEFINEANKIMRERMKNRGSTINSKSRMKGVILNDTKEICLKNYLIDLLKEKRTDINEKERNITKALKESEETLDKDYQDFMKFVEDTKDAQKKEEKILNDLKNKHEAKLQEFKSEMIENKKSTEEFEKTLKNICLLKTYGSFVHKVLGLNFVFDDISEFNSRERNYEILGDLILEKYDHITELKELNDVKDDSVLLLKFSEYEDKVIKELQSKEILAKENEIAAKSHQSELKELERREKNCKEEERRIENENNQVILGIKRQKMAKGMEVEAFMNFIIELGIETGELKDKTKGKRNILDVLAFTKEIFDVLEKKEDTINGYINEILYIENHGDKDTIHKIKEERKRKNKADKQTLLIQKQKQLDLMKQKKAAERGQKVIIKGRKVPKDFPILKGKKARKNDKEANDFDDYAMLHYSSDENER